MDRLKLTGRDSDFARVGLKVAARGDLEAVQWLLGQHGHWLTQIGPHGRTMLWEAAYKGRVESVEYLLAAGALVDLPGCYYTPMLAEVSPQTAALLKGHAPVVEMLAAHGAELDLHDACYIGDEAFVRAQLERDPSVILQKKTATDDLDAATPLFYAVAGTQPRVLELLLGALGKKRIDGGGLLMRWAAWRRNVEVVELLLAHGADPRESGIADWAIDEQLNQLAQRHGFSIDINAPNWLGFPALVDTCRGNHNLTDDPARALKLLERGADINARDHKGKTALHRAAQAGFVQIPKLLLERGADIDARDELGETPLFGAVRGGRVAAVEFLLGAGANPRTQNGKGRSVADVKYRLSGADAERMRELLSS